MTTHYTKYFRFPIPDFLTEPWVQELSTTFDIIDMQLYSNLAASQIMNWENSTAYAVGQVAIDPDLGTVWSCQVANNSAAAPTTFAQDRAAHPTYWGFGVVTVASAASVTYANGTSGLVAANVQAAIDEVDSHVDAINATKAPLASPIFTGDPQVPTQATSDNDASIASTAFVRNAVSAYAIPEAPNDGQQYGRQSHAWTIIPAAAGGGTITPSSDPPLMDGVANPGALPTYSRGDHVHPTDTTRASVASVPIASSTTPVMNGTAAVGIGTTWARADHVHPTDTTRASVASVPVAADTAPLMAGAAAIGTSTLYARQDHVHPIDTSRRERLTAARTYYVRTDGNDSNTGLVNNAGGAFLTVQRAILVTAALDLNSNPVTIQLAAGTYTGAVVVNGIWEGYIGGGNVKIFGDTTTPSNVVMSVNNSNAISVINGGRLTIAGVKITTTVAGSCIAISQGGVLSVVGNMEFGSAVYSHISCTTGGQYVCVGGVPYTISGGAQTHWSTDGAGCSILSQGSTITLVGTPAFSSAFAMANTLSSQVVNGNTFAGTAATGYRYSVGANSIIQTYGAGATYLPGSIAGTTSSGGLYQ